MRRVRGAQKAVPELARRRRQSPGRCKLSQSGLPDHRQLLGEEKGRGVADDDAEAADDLEDGVARHPRRSVGAVHGQQCIAPALVQIMLVALEGEVHHDLADAPSYFFLSLRLRRCSRPLCVTHIHLTKWGELSKMTPSHACDNGINNINENVAYHGLEVNVSPDSSPADGRSATQRQCPTTRLSDPTNHPRTHNAERDVKQQFGET